MKAWLITWEWAGEHAAVVDRIAGLVSPRFAATRVRQIVELLYARAQYTIEEMALFVRKPQLAPYKALDEGGGQIVCGHNPFLYARKVTELVVVRDDQRGVETVRWKDPIRFRWSEASGRFVPAGPATPDECSRLLDRPICDLLRSEAEIRWLDE